jgi:hypothetical protein
MPYRVSILQLQLYAVEQDAEVGVLAPVGRGRLAAWHVCAIPDHAGRRHQRGRQGTHHGK